MSKTKKTEVMELEVDVDQVPSIIRDQFIGLKALRDNVDTATKKADLAKNSALSAKNKSSFWFKSHAIEALQEATVDLADAQISSVQAQEVSFEYQQRIAEITKYLFALGVSNIAMNRSVVRELEMKLEGASKEELDEFARQEIVAVVKQLKAQEDIMEKQNDLSEKVKSHELRIRENEDRGDENARRLAEHEQEQ